MRTSSTSVFSTTKRAFDFGIHVLKHSNAPMREALVKCGWLEKAGSTTQNAAGGFLVPDNLAGDIENAINISGVFRQHARVRRIPEGVLMVPKRLTQAAASFKPENQGIAESNRIFGNYLLQTQTAGLLSKVSNELNEDAIADLGAEFAREFTAAFADLEDACGFNGDGTSTYGGMRGVTTSLIDGTHTASVVTAGAGHDTFEELDAADISNLMSLLPERWWQTAKFYVSSYAAAKAFCRLGATVGGLIDTIDGRRPMMSFLGFPIVVTPKLPGSGTQSGKVMVLFGDLYGAATLGIRREMKIQVLDDVYQDQGQIGILGRHRFSVAVHSLGDNSTAGPIVGLVGA